MAAVPESNQGKKKKKPGSGVSEGIQVTQAASRLTGERELGGRCLKLGNQSRHNDGHGECVDPYS